MKFRLITVGGTFDHLHRGHEAILMEAFRRAERVSVAITSDRMLLDKPLAQQIEPYEVRKQAVIAFLKRQGLLPRAEFQTLNDIYGTAITKSEMDAIIVTRQTLPNAWKINKIRQKKQLKTLQIVTFNLVCGLDRLPISSSRIREGEEDRQGRVYHGNSLGLSGRFITEALRTKLRFPLGRFIPGQSSALGRAARRLVESKIWRQATMRISVGDAATASILAVSQPPEIAVVDLRIRRRKVFQTLSELGFNPSIKAKIAKNPRGTLSRGLFKSLRMLIKESLADSRDVRVLQIYGEEDLATLPAVLLSPLGSVVVYGQPPIANGEVKEGLVVVEVSESTKERILEIVAKFPKARVSY